METMAEESGLILLELLAARGVLADVSKWWIRRATGGVNNQVFLAGEDGSPASLTIRVAAGREEPRLTREANVLSALPQTVSCVPVLRCAITDGPKGFGTVLVYRYADGTVKPVAEVTPEQAARLGRSLAGLHAVRQEVYTIWPDLVPQRGSYADCWNDRLAAIARYRFLEHPEGNPARSLLDRLQRLDLDDAWRGESFCQLHGDLGPGNIIWGDEDITLIDWEYTRAGDAAEDLAYLLGEQPVPTVHRQAVFDGYLAAGGDPEAIHRHRAYLPLIALDSALWWADYALERGLAPLALPEMQERLALTRRSLNFLD